MSCYLIRIPVGYTRGSTAREVPGAVMDVEVKGVLVIEHRTLGSRGRGFR